MRAVRNNRYICILLTWMLLLMGMCTDFTSARSLSASANPLPGAYTSCIVRSGVTEPEVFLEENTAGYEIIGSAEGETYIRQEAGSTGSFTLASAKSVSGKPVLSCKRLAQRIRCYHPESAAIICYVHNKDGSKG